MTVVFQHVQISELICHSTAQVQCHLLYICEQLHQLSNRGVTVMAFYLQILTAGYYIMNFLCEMSVTHLKVMCLLSATVCVGHTAFNFVTFNVN